MSAIQSPYLGLPGAMQQLPSPNGPIDEPSSRGDTAVTVLSGGQSVVRRLHQRRTYNLPFLSLADADADVILGFYQGLYGIGPYVYVDASVRNVLGLDVSTVGLRTAAPLNWLASTGTLTRSATGGPTGVQSGVLTWGSLAASAYLAIGTVLDVANKAAAPVYLPTEAVTVSMYLKASTATTATMRISGYDVNGARQAFSSVPGTVAITTSWQRFTLSAAAGNGTLAGNYYVLPWLLLGATVPTTVSVAAVQLEYGTVATNFQPGYGSPRVVITASPGRNVPQYGASDYSLILGEVG